jgi:galactokinase
MIEAFRQLYGSAEGIRVFRAPGRVNLIGEHTDYNLGFVMPMALHLATFVATASSPDGKLHIYSEQRRQMYECPLAGLPQLKPQGTWTDYPIGVAQELVRSGFLLAPANLLIRSTVPEGAGLSSSAALEVSSALALLQDRDLEPRELAQLCQRAENRYVGIPSGIMDQFASIFGRKHSAIELDCRNLEHRLVSLPEVEFVAVNTMVKHALAGSEYRDRVRECAAAVAHIRTGNPSVSSLRDVPPDRLSSFIQGLPPVIARRARHVVTENARVEAFVAASERSDLSAMGKLLVASHRSLQHDYEVSCPELDFLVDRSLLIPGVYGARMTGGGFGGSIVAMLESSALQRFEEALSKEYIQQFGLTPSVIICRPSAGAAEVRNFETIPQSL